MKTTLLLLLFPLLLFLVAHADASDLKCSKKTIAELGKDVTLDCYCEPRCDVTGEELKWKFNQNTFVLAYIGTYNLNQQAAQFIGRAQVSSAERLNDGNLPVTISKVIKSDEGTYTCHVGSKTCSVELKAQEFQLKCQEKPVEVRVGQNIILNCTSEPQLDLTEEKITWKVNSTIVLNFKDKKMSPYQDEQFKGRVHPVSDWKVSEGKLSVEISSVNENDAGVYTCSVVHVSKCTVTLIVKKEDKQTSGGAQGDDIPPPSDGLSTGAKIAIVAVVLVLVFAALAAWLIYRNRSKSQMSPLFVFPVWQVVGALISGTTNYDLQEEHKFVCYLFGAGGMRQVHTSFHTGVQEAQGAGKAELLLR